MRRLPRSLTHALLALGMSVWVFSSFASGLHMLLVQHVVCADHGEIVELDGHQAEKAVAPSADGPQISSADAHDHDHGCSDQLVDRLGLLTPPAKPAGFLVLKWTLAPMRGAEAPRGPPLAYAPKTSPPTIA